MSKAKGFTISLQAVIYPGALAARTLHTTTTWRSTNVKHPEDDIEILKHVGVYII